MKALQFSVVILVAFAGSALGFAAQDGLVEPIVIGGAVAVSGQYPETVYINTPRGSCVGVVLNANHILTSCQCVLDGQNATNPFFVRIIAGDLNLFTPTYRRFTAQATHIYSHPRYNQNTLENDVAVVRITPEFPLPHNTIDTAVLSQRVQAINTGCQFAGWGFSAANLQTRNAVQRVINMPILNRDTCNAGNVHQNRVLESMVCAGSVAVSTAAVCGGNLGGGLFCNNELVGILAFGQGCGIANMPSVFTQVRFHATWIRQQFTRTDATFR